jgi:hypothetical protein
MFKMAPIGHHTKHSNPTETTFKEVKKNPQDNTNLDVQQNRNIKDSHIDVLSIKVQK